MAVFANGYLLLFWGIERCCSLLENSLFLGLTYTGFNMKALKFVALLSVFISTAASGQNTFRAISSGVWSAAGTWNCGGCGESFPNGGDDDVFTNGFNVTVDGAYSIRNLGVRADVVSLTFGSNTLTITGSISGVDAGDFPSAPTTNVFSGAPRLSFTAADINTNSFFLFFDEVIGNWNNLSPLGTVTMSLANDAVIDSEANGSLSFTSLNISPASGSKTISTGLNLSALLVSGTLGIANNVTFDCSVPISGTGGASTRATALSLAGRLNAGSYVNVTGFGVSPTGYFQSEYSGTEGWWNGTTRPSSYSIAATSTISYASSSAQTVLARTYGNLVFSGGTKTLNGTGLTIQGNFDCSASFAPSSIVTFSGGTAQSFSGTSGTVTFGGGVAVTKTANSIVFNRSSTISGSLSTTSATSTLNLGDVTTTLNAMTISNAGTISSGTSGTLVAQGAIDFSGTGSYTLNNITANAAVTFDNSVNVAITGNVTNNSSVTFPTSGTVTFNNSNNQLLSGNAMTIVNMTVNKPTGTLTNNTTLTLIGLLTMQSGTFDADGSGSSNFILYSDANQDARIGAMTGGIISGNVVFQRYFVNSSTAWRNFSFPVNNVPVSELTDDITVVNGSLAYYTESTLGNVDQGWTTVATNGTLTASRGYSAYMYYSGNYTIDVRGTLLANQPTLAGASAYNYGVTFTDDPAFDTGVNDGWNLLPNPYACPINWNAASGWQKTNVNGAAAIWDGNGLSYRYSNGSWDGVIAQGQAFWVQTTAGSPVLTSTESVKVSNSDPTFYRTGNSDEKMFINLTSEGKTDVLTVGFNEEATAGFDSQYDANKLKNRIFNFSAIGTDGSTLAVSVMPKSACANAIQLKLTDTKAGEYTMSFERVNSLLDVNKITITDRFTEKTVAVTDAATYNFTITTDPRSADPNRFVMNIEFADPELATPQIIANGTELRTNIRNGIQWFLNGEAIPGATNQVLNTTQNGLYQVKVISQGCEAASEALRLTEQRAGRFYPNPAEGIIKADLSNLLEQAKSSSGTIEFYSVSGVLVKTVNFDSSDFSKSIDVDQLPKGHYLVKVKSSSDKTMVQERVVIK